ncbi:MAG: c-type cytochrome [Alphaproteobacteria bacterium]|nr:c-type cytochrome [Alphaproteobacteria bacterium]
MSLRPLPMACFAAILTLSSVVAAQEKPNWRDGRKVFKQCGSCHTFKPGEHRFGPSLAGFYGRKAGTAPDFSYSAGMKEKSGGGLVWTTETLDTFLTAPKKFIPQTKMSFKGLASETDRRNVIAYAKRRSKR